MHLAQLAQLGGRAVPWNNGTRSWGPVHGEVFSDDDWDLIYRESKWLVASVAVGLTSLSFP